MLIKGTSKTMKTSSIIYKGLTKFKTKHKVHLKVPSQLWRHLRRQSGDGTRLSLLFIEIFILVLVVHTEHSICSTLGLQRHGGTWWPIVSRILIWSVAHVAPAVSRREDFFDLRLHDTSWTVTSWTVSLFYVEYFLLWGDRHAQIVAEISIGLNSWARPTPNLCLLSRVQLSVLTRAALWQLYTR
jgi:hypothetical protein